MLFGRPVASATSTGESADAPKANVDDIPTLPTAAKGGMCEDSDADPEADALVVGLQGLLSSKKEGAQEGKITDRPWAKTVRYKLECLRESRP